MVRKSNPHALKVLFLIVQLSIFLVVVGGVLWVTASSHKDNVLEVFSAKLDNAAETMVAQLKANQVPSSLGPEGNGVFIINQNDGAVVVDKHMPTDANDEDWQRYRTKLIYEMQKQKRGWIVYPDRKNWKWDQKQRVIRYMAIDDLGWILAVEAERPTDWRLLREAFKRSNYVFMLLLILFGGLSIWLINERYFFLIWRSVTDTVENNFMSLSGEDSIWNKFKTSTHAGEDLEKEALGLGGMPSHNHTANSHAKEPEVPTIETLKVPAPTEEFKPIDPAGVGSAAFQQSHPSTESKAPTVGETAAQHREAKSDDESLTININEIKSQALKRILKGLREK